jgi:DNA polymerase V
MYGLPNLYTTPVSCGFPSPAQDYIETSLDLNERLITKPASTFFVRTKGDSMQNAGIFDGDLLIIDRSVSAKHNHIVLAILNGEFTLKKLMQKNGQTLLIAENQKYSPISITEDCDFQVWGVATYCIHKL